MIDLEPYLLTPPTNRIGAPVGYVDTNTHDWFMVVEMLLPTPINRWWGPYHDAPASQWGTAKWADLAWVDVTGFVRGMEWRVGSDEYNGRPVVGVADIEFDNADRRFSVLDLSTEASSGIKSDNRQPGTLVRISCVADASTHADGWIPMFTGIVESWGPEETLGVGADRFITITAVDTVSALAKIDENALASVVGDGDTPGERIGRLLDAADWPYGFDDVATAAGFTDGAVQLQSTDMANNRLTECYLTADSVGLVFRSGRDGRAWLGEPYNRNTGYLSIANPYRTPFYGLSSLHFRPDETGSAITYVADSLATLNDDYGLYNEAQLAFVGGSVLTYYLTTQPVTNRRIYKRTDLICKNTGGLARAATEVLTAATQPYRPDHVTIDHAHPGVLPALMCLDVDDGDVYVHPEPAEYPRSLVEISYIEHRFTPLNEAESRWTATVGFDHASTDRQQRLPS